MYNKLTLERWLWDSTDLKNYIFGLLFIKRANDQFIEEAKIAIKDDTSGYSITCKQFLKDC